MSYATWKRALDLCGAALLLAVTFPVCALIAVLLLLAQGPPILYRQRRVGQHGVPFSLVKFRTMRHGPPAPLPDRPVARHADPRVTPLGRVLRRLALDELPQLVNVLRGEMSLVGPRPLPVEDLAHPGWLDNVPASEREQRRRWAERRQAVPPGLTGLWQITANEEADFANWIACDLAYVDRRSLALDLLILMRTPWAVLRGRRGRRA